VPLGRLLGAAIHLVADFSSPTALLSLTSLTAARSATSATVSITSTHSATLRLITGIAPFPLVTLPHQILALRFANFTSLSLGLLGCRARLRSLRQTTFLVFLLESGADFGSATDRFGASLTALCFVL